MSDSRLSLLVPCTIYTVRAQSVVAPVDCSSPTGTPIEARPYTLGILVELVSNLCINQLSYASSREVVVENGTHTAAVQFNNVDSTDITHAQLLKIQTTGFRLVFVHQTLL